MVCKYLRVVLLCYFNSCPLRESAAYKINSAKEFDEKPPAYASLTDLRDFYFFRYDNSKFTLYQDEKSLCLVVRGLYSWMRRRVVCALTSIPLPLLITNVYTVQVTEHLFFITVEGNVGNLDADTSRSKKYRGSARGCTFTYSCTPIFYLTMNLF